MDKCLKTRTSNIIMLDPIKFCKLMKKFTSFCIRYPSIRADEIDSLIRRKDLPPGDVLEYSSCSSNRPKRITFLIIAAYLLYMFKSAIYILFTLKARYHVGSDLKVESVHRYNETSTNLDKAYSCLRTNCSLLSKARTLTEDLHGLPIFSICNPTLRPFYTPYVDLGPLGILIHIMAIVFVLCLNIVLPIKQIILPANDESIMFVTAPRVAKQIVYEQFQKVREEFLQSYETFLASTSCPGVMTCYGRFVGYFPGLLPARQKHVTLSSSYPSSWIGSREKPKEEREAKEDRFDYNPGDPFLLDCLPAIRSQWWRRESALIYWKLFASIITFQTVTAILVLIYSQMKISHMHAKMKRYTEDMAESNCSLWVQRETSVEFGARHLVHLESLKFDWSIYGICETILILAIPYCAIAIVLAINYVTNSELSCWLKELRLHSRLALEILQIGLDPRVREEIVRSTIQYGTKPNDDDDGYYYYYHHYDHDGGSGGRIKFRMANMRRRFVSGSELKFLIVRCESLESKTETDAHLAARELALNYVLRERPQDRLELQAVMLEKLYMNYRILITTVRRYSKHITVLIILSHLIAYSLALVCAYVMKTVRDLSSIAITILIAFLSLIVPFISLSSNFHAQAKRLQTIGWSIVALLTQFKGPYSSPLNHLRLLWFRQTTMLDDEDGLAIGANGLRVTYVNAIQVLIWSATIIILVLK